MLKINKEFVIANAFAEKSNGVDMVVKFANGERYYVEAVDDGFEVNQIGVCGAAFGHTVEEAARAWFDGAI